MLSSGWVINKLHHDYGFDYVAQPVEEEIVTNDLALFQVKARASPLRWDSQQSSTIRLMSADLRRWSRVPLPAYLAVVDLSTEEIYLSGCQEIASTYNDEIDKQLSVTTKFAGSAHASLKLPKIRDETIMFWDVVRHAHSGHRLVSAFHHESFMLRRIIRLSELFDEMSSVWGRARAWALFEIAWRRLPA